MPSGAKYVGDWQHDMRWGKGKATYSSGKVLEGEWEQNKFASKKGSSKGDRYAKRSSKRKD